MTHRLIILLACIFFSMSHVQASTNTIPANRCAEPATSHPTCVADSVAADKAAQRPWKCILRCNDENVRLEIDLYEESIEVPGMDMFGPMNGYLNGNVYGVWTVTSFKILDDKNATLRLSNDLGSETQECTLTIDEEGKYNLHLKGSTVIKRVEKKKLVKVNSSMTFTRVL